MSTRLLYWHNTTAFLNIKHGNSRQQEAAAVSDPFLEQRSTKDQVEAPGGSSSSFLFSLPGIADASASVLTIYATLLDLGTVYCITLAYHSVLSVMSLLKTSCYVQTTCMIGKFHGSSACYIYLLLTDPRCSDRVKNQWVYLVFYNFINQIKCITYTEIILVSQQSTKSDSNGT